jgi:hypothetical protein
MLRLLLVLVACVVALAGAQPSAGVRPEARGDLELLVRELERIHPNPYHSISRAELRAAADALAARLPELDDDEFLVELMRLVARLGEREGHTGVNYLARAHLYPFFLYAFDEGFHVVAARRGLPVVGARLTAIGGRPVEQVVELVRPIMTRDNETNLKAVYSFTLVTAEILHGLGVTPTRQRATFTFQRTGGRAFDVELTPVRTAAWQNALRYAYPTFTYGLPAQPKLTFLRNRSNDQWLTTLSRGRVAYLAYRSVQQDSWELSERLRRVVARKSVRRVIVDLRNNGGGDNRRYAHLLNALTSRGVRGKALVVIIGRETFSAATHFAADLKLFTRAIFVGEPTGGAPNHYSDTDPVDLPVTRWTVGIPTIHYQKMPGQLGLALEPDVAVQLTARDFFSNRDPVLARALRVSRQR